jgi:hypothetical protein
MNPVAFFHPFTLSGWVALSCIMIQYLNWWPKPEYGFLGYLLPLPAFGCWGAVILYLMDWYVDSHTLWAAQYFNLIGSTAHISKMRLLTCYEDQMSRTLQTIIGGLPHRAFSFLNMPEILSVS